MKLLITWVSAIMDSRNGNWKMEQWSLVWVSWEDPENHGMPGPDVADQTLRDFSSG